jgi:glycosyltransferase involved in cell wall biosynthesis
MMVLGSDGSPRRASLAWCGADVLVLSPTPTHPQDYGNRNRIFRICSRLTERGARITFVHYPAEAEWLVRVPAAAGAMARAWHAYYTIPLTRPAHPPPQSTDHTIDEWWDETIGEFLRWLFRVSSFDVFLVNFSWLSKAFDTAPGWVVKILDTHDRLAGRRSLLGRLGIAPEYFHTTDDEEAIALNRADVVWAIKDRERVHFERLTLGPVLSLPHLDPVRPVPIPAPDPEGYLRVGVIGARSNLNLKNLRHFLETAIPIFARYFAPVMIFIAGSVCDLLHGVDERFVRLIGRVDDVKDFYRTVDLVCVAVRSSTGIKTKTGEAIALGLPVVSLAHGFEGYAANHPLHRLASFEEMAERLVAIAFDRDLLPGLRAASLSSAHATEAAIDATIERTWQIVAQMRRAVIFCVSAVVFDDHAPERWAFVSALEYLGRMADVVVLVVAGSIELLLHPGCEPDSRARVVVAAPLVDGDERAARLQAKGFGIGAIDDVLAGYGQKIVIVDALSDHLLDIASAGGMVVLRAELLAQRMAIEPEFDAIGAFLGKFARPVLMAPRSSPVLGALAARSGADIVTAPCCWRSVALRRRIGGRRRRQVLLLTDGRLRGLVLLARLLRDLELEPVLVRPLGTDLRFATPAALGGAADWRSAREYLSGIAGGKQALPEFAADLSFGALGLQYLREILLRLGVPTICADAAAVKSSAIAADDENQVHTYEGLVAKILSAASSDAPAPESQRRRLELELEGDSGWDWLWRYGFDALGFDDINPAWLAGAST